MTGRRALFLDRDGVINHDSGYVHRRQDFHFLPGIFETVARARTHGCRIIVVTNQSGIGRTLFSEAEFEDLTRWMVARFAAEGVVIDRVYHCPYHPTEGVGRWRRDHDWRKPKPGMILQAALDFDLDLPACAMIGDSGTDIQAAIAAGVGLPIMLGATVMVGAHAVPTLSQAAVLLDEWFKAT